MRGERQKDTTTDYRIGWEKIWGSPPFGRRVGDDYELELTPDPDLKPGEPFVRLVPRRERPGLSSEQDVPMYLDQARTKVNDR